MIEYKGVKWYHYQGALLPKIPPHKEMNLTKEEQKELLKLSKALFLRYTNEWDRKGGEFWYVIKDEKEDLKIYKSKIRNQIKKGLRNCIVKKVNREIIAQIGYQVYFEAFKKYGTNFTPISKNNFKESILKSKDDFWAVYNKENILIGYSQNFLIEKTCGYGTIKYHPDHLHLYPSYALIYRMNEYYINENNFQYVSDGARNLYHKTNIQSFLIKKFHFRKAYCRLNVVYRADIKIIISILFPFRNLIKNANNNFLRKVYSILKQEEIRRSFEK